MGALWKGHGNELFEHYQKLSFNFYVSIEPQLMTRISNDSFDLAELYHHGPEDIVILITEFYRCVCHPHQHQY